MESRGPVPEPVPAGEHLTTRLFERASSDRVILRYRKVEARASRADDDGWAGFSWRDLAERVSGIAAGLVALGVGPGDRVGLLSAQRVEWTLADLSVLAAGAVTVPLYETSSPEQCSWILSDSGCEVAVVESSDLARTLHQAAAPALREVLVIDDRGLDTLVAAGTPEGRAEVRRRAAGLSGADLASIVYTSGTTGPPKGCMLTHRNLLWVARQAGVGLPMLFGPQQSTLNFLPLAHVFARIIQFGCLDNDTTLGYARSLSTLAEDLRSFRPTFLLGVPRAYDKLLAAARKQASSKPRRAVFDFAVRTAEELAAEQRPGPRLQVRRTIADRLVYARLREALGGRLRYCLSGGAALPAHLGTFFAAAGVPILEGYGLTETSAPATVSTPDAAQPGTVGRPLPGVTVRVAEDGQLAIRGGGVFRGYWNNAEATDEVLDAGAWFLTGDLGAIEDGFVRITGRVKETIVTAGGKNVAPGQLEDRLVAHRLISQAMVVGDGRPFIGALLTLNDDELGAIGHRRDGAALERELQGAVDEANQTVSRAEAIQEWRVLGRQFDEEHDELTPTMKLRRPVIAEHFAEEIEGLYEAGGG